MLASCLATAVTLNNLFAQFLQKLFNNRLSKCVVLGCTSGVAFMMSLLNFSGITTILIPILDTIYPGIIVYTLINLVHPNQHVIKRVAFYGITAFMIAIILCT
jgi:LIVCS family branched-chain amino acid:cation transporter